MTVQIKEAFDGGPYALTLVVRDLATSAEFYGSKLGLAQIFSDEVSAVFRCGRTMINLLLASAATELVEPASLSNPNAGVGAVYTLVAANIDAVAKELIAGGITLLNGPIDRPWGVRTVSFQDPDGHTWEFADHS
ncbi:MAG: VOC family protein [Micrococcales bacterium]